MSRTAELQDLYRFNGWANARIRDALTKLTAAEFSQDLKSSHPSIRDTVLHIMSSEWVWLQRWLGTSPKGMPEEWRALTFEQIQNEWAALEVAHQAFVAALSDPELDRVVDYRNLKGESFSNPLWQLLRHMVNHSTYHRGQVTTMLRQLGHAAVATDLVVYYRLPKS